MARRDDGTAVLDREALDESVNGTGAEGATEGATGDAPARRTRAKRNPEDMGPEEIISLNVRVPNALRAQLAGTATEQNTSVPQLVAKMLADAYGFELPKPQRAARVKKYASAEERKQAQKDAQAKQRLITKAVLKAVEDGTIDVDVEALIARIKEEEAAKAVASTEGAAS